MKKITLIELLSVMTFCLPLSASDLVEDGQNIDNKTHILSLPNEIFDHIFSFFPITDDRSVSQLISISEVNILWKNLTNQRRKENFKIFGENNILIDGRLKGMYSHQLISFNLDNRQEIEDEIEAIDLRFKRYENSKAAFENYKNSDNLISDKP